MRRLSDIILNQNPLELAATTSVQDACAQMSKRRIGSVLVIDESGSLSGIFTGRDAVHRVIALGKNADHTVLVDVMTSKPVTMPPDKSAIEALRLMWDGGFRHLPVVDDGRILGVVSRGDFQGSEKDRLDEERNLWEHLR
jgi:CBS domain-containing protein